MAKIPSNSFHFQVVMLQNVDSWGVNIHAVHNDIRVACNCACLCGFSPLPWDSSNKPKTCVIFFLIYQWNQTLQDVPWLLFIIFLHPLMFYLILNVSVTWRKQHLKKKIIEHYRYIKWIMKSTIHVYNLYWLFIFLPKPAP